MYSIFLYYCFVMIDTHHLNNVSYWYHDPGLHEQWLESVKNRLQISREELLNLISQNNTNWKNNQKK